MNTFILPAPPLTVIVNPIVKQLRRLSEPGREITNYFQPKYEEAMPQEARIALGAFPLPPCLAAAVSTLLQEAPVGGRSLSFEMKEYFLLLRGFCEEGADSHSDSEKRLELHVQVDQATDLILILADVLLLEKGLHKINTTSSEYPIQLDANAVAARIGATPRVGLP